MKKRILINANICTDGKIFHGSITIDGSGRIEKVSPNTSPPDLFTGEVIDCQGLYLLPGAIDDQVHFREPGLTHKGDIYTESRAAVAGGVTSFMEMPNTIPNTLTEKLLEDKYGIAANTSVANYSFYMGTSNDNTDELLRVSEKRLRDVCGVKIFMGSSTGNMLVDDHKVLERIFSECPMLIATHCEDEATIKANTEKMIVQYGGIEKIPIKMHPVIRDEEACYLSSSFAVGLARKHKTRLHVLHISSLKELNLFDSKIPLENKLITAEACVHHLHFTTNDYEKLGTLIKWNPAIKLNGADRNYLLKNVFDDNVIDVIASDHAPHTWDEKQQGYKSPSGAPLVQHTLPAMLHMMNRGIITISPVVEKMCHNPAIAFKIKDRGFIREGYWADLVLVDMNKGFHVTKENILYKCGWSPLENQYFSVSVEKTFVNGELVYENGKGIVSKKSGMRLLFDR